MKYIFSSIAGNIEIKIKDMNLITVEFTLKPQSPPDYIFQSRGEEELCARTELQIKEYFMGKRQQFDVPVYITGTEFQKNVWAQIRKLEYGEKISYTELTRRCLLDKNSVRAVANAVAKNPLILIVPCHRIIKKTGGIGKYAGGTYRKNYLLELEQKNLLD
jgi:O-6-methylguanine DNA methyltransferase